MLRNWAKNHIFKTFLFGCFGLVVITNSVGNVSPATFTTESRAETSNSATLDASTNAILNEDMNSLDCDQLKVDARTYGVDYRFILAIIKQESQFDENAVSKCGARGLMQIMPQTNMELNEELDLVETQLPAQNVVAGIYYFSKLYDLFEGANREDRLKLALASYNAGPSRIYDAQELAAYFGEDPSKWSAIQNMLPLLSKRFYSLHELVWKGSKPPAGYFGGWRQTTMYVDAVMKTYRRYSTGS